MIVNKHFCYTVVFTLLIAASPLSYAAGCLKGAAVGAAVGHLKHHAVLGAVGGCVVGHHMAAKDKKEQAKG
ncbi:hypothetical protein [Sodalis sp. dw_96]|uniref:hypothetical protein n=1 Tax=Sodalis sp. dw_96 TaxID=2719794 RepID=UPI001BD52BF6|nr:hypothetical protein [Sodalis sp. dw_96]